MSLIAKEKSEYIPLPEGQYPAVISAVVDLGLQDCFGSPKHQLLIRYEIPGLRNEHDGLSEPRVKWQFYTLSLNNKANLRRDLERIRGKGFTREELDGFDIMNILGSTCEIEIIHDYSTGSPRDKIMDISKFRGDGNKPTSELEIIRYTPEENENWDELPDWVREKIRNQLVKPTTSDSDAAAEAVTEKFEEDDLEDVPF